MEGSTVQGKDSEQPLNATFVNEAFELEVGESVGIQSRHVSQEAAVNIPSSEAVTYSWENIEVHLDMKQGNCFKRQPPIQKRVLNKVTGCARPGEILAIMGASGAGKTTLLNCLTFRNTGQLKVAGERYLNGALVNTDVLAHISGYVQQDDLFVPTFKAKEHLEFQAMLRMDSHLTYNERMARVNQVIHELGLTKCENAIIGNPERGVKGISGGERKRLAFASEVLTNPSLLFCDEPTSGLDSYMTGNIVQVLKSLASSGKTIICTIHQPSSEVFAMFDRILLMAEGRTAFLGTTSEALSFFSLQGIPCPQNYNPADFYIHTLATVPGQETACREKCKEICDAYDSSDIGRALMKHVASNRPVVNDNQQRGTLTDVAKKTSPYKASWFAQFQAVLWRSFISVFRDPAVVGVKGFQAIVIAIIIALAYQGQDLVLDDIRNIQGVLFIFITFITYQNIFGVVNVFTSELPLFLREHFNGMYRTDVYFLCKTLAELPTSIIFPFVFVLIPYFVIGLNPAVERFFIACGIMILIANVTSAFGFMISCIAKSTDLALALAPPLILPLFLFGGFFLSNEDVPVYFDWIRYISWFMYGYETLSINQWDGLSLDGCPQFANCTGERILSTLGCNPDYFYRDIGGLLALMFGYQMLALIALLSKTYRKK